MTTLIPPYGFPVTEFEARTVRAQQLMRNMRLDALLLMTEPEIAYYAGFNSYFWQSPTRPWFLVIPLSGEPIAVVPSIGVTTVANTWIQDVRSWQSPNPADEGVSLLASTLKELGTNYKRIGVPTGPETHLRMPGNDVQTLNRLLGGISLVDATDIVKTQRMVKSSLEIAKHQHICELVSDSFENVPRIIHTGMSEREAFHAFRLDILSRKATSAPYLVTTSGPGGIDDAIRFPCDRVLNEGDLLFIDTGCEYDGYYSDFDRNFALGAASDEALFAYRLAYKATEAGIAAVKPGVKSSDVFKAMAKVLEEGGASNSSIGRMGHGVGLKNTEWPSIMASDDTVLQAGMILAIEPGYEFLPGKIMLHEENVVVRDEAAQLLSRRADPELPILT